MTEQVNRCKDIASNADKTLKGMKHRIWSQKQYSLTYAPPLSSLRVVSIVFQSHGSVIVF